MDKLFDNLVFSFDTPIFMQVILYIKRKIVAGALKHGDELPSRRKLAVQLGINPNTVQKIYKQLEDEGLILSSQGAKSVLCITNDTYKLLKQEIVRQELGKTLNALKQSGASLQDVLDMTVHLWAQNETEDKQ